MTTVPSSDYAHNGNLLENSNHPSRAVDGKVGLLRVEGTEATAQGTNDNNNNNYYNNIRPATTTATTTNNTNANSTNKHAFSIAVTPITNGLTTTTTAASTTEANPDAAIVVMDSLVSNVTSPTSPLTTNANVTITDTSSFSSNNGITSKSTSPSSSTYSSSETEDASLLATASATAEGPRRSGRERISTVIHVDGYAVKKDNNYVLKGLTYQYGVAQGEEHPPVPKQRAPTTTTKAAVKPREISVAEQNRLLFKERVTARIQAKQARRQDFLKTNLDKLEPFLEPKVVQQIQQYSTLPLTLSSSVTEYATEEVVAQPTIIQATMRDYQLEALKWMSDMYSKNVGFILGDEMGLGKTLQTIALVCHLKEKHGATGPSLIVAPLSVLNSWCNEIRKWAPSLKFHQLHLSNAEKIDLPSELNEFDMVVTTYEMIKVPALRYLWSRQHFNLVVLDEGHRIKSLQAQVSQAVRHIHCENRVILTGTPLANNLVELHALLNFLAPDVFTTVEPFAAAYDLNSNSVDRSKLDQANKVLNTFMLRRLKSLVEKKMPKKIETKVICPLSNTQIWWYKALLLKDLNLLTGDGTKPAGALSNLIMQLRKCCNHPYLFPFVEDPDDEGKLANLIGASGKLAVLDMLLRSLYTKGHRVVLFSQFTKTLDILDDYCKMRGWSYCRFDGGTARAERNFVVNSFSAVDSDKFIFLMSTRSGGMGLNLQTADTVILFDSDWNPQADIQAEARVHRIGQTKTVFVYRLVTANTVEERIAERAEKKLYLDRMVMRDGKTEDATKDSTEEDAATEDAGKLMSTLKFGCNAVFGDKAQQKMALPTEEDIEMLTDRSRTENFTGGKIHGGTDTNAEDFDVTKEFTSTTKFGEIDFAKLREKHKKRPKDLGNVCDIWRKRHRKNRIKMVNGIGSGYGAKAVPVLTTNDYDLQSGERSVFQQELGGDTRNFKNVGRNHLKGGEDFDWQETCQNCGDGGSLLCCPRCPVAVHLHCSGVSRAKDFLCCSHHRCFQCNKNSQECGGFMFRCSCCPAAYCEDHVPPNARPLERCERMEKLGYKIKHGIYIHCSPICENVAIQDFGWVPYEKRGPAPCPPPLDLSSFFDGEIDDSTDAPENLILNTKRRRKEINYAARDRPGLVKKEEPQRAPAMSGSGLSARPSFTPGTATNFVDMADDKSDDDDDYEEEWKPLSTVATGSTNRVKPATTTKRRKSATYKVHLPVTSDGIMVNIGEIHGRTHFLGYRKHRDGSTPWAESQGLFRRIGDRIVAVSDIATHGKTFQEVMKLIADAKSSVRGVVTLGVEDIFLAQTKIVNDIE